MSKKLWDTTNFQSFAQSSLDMSNGEDSCWPFIGGKNWAGYGHFVRRGVHYRAHRVAYELAYGLVPDGKSVCHSCDNPPCCNPKHLWVGTHQENMMDKTAKGRVVTNPNRGMKSIQARLTDNQVRDIRNEYVPQKPGPRTNGRFGLSRRELAVKYGVSKSLIDHIINGTAWTHID